jgi:hypothetical protein
MGNLQSHEHVQAVYNIVINAGRNLWIPRNSWPQTNWLVDAVAINTFLQRLLQQAGALHNEFSVFPNKRGPAFATHGVTLALELGESITPWVETINPSPHVSSAAIPRSPTASTAPPLTKLEGSLLQFGTVGPPLNISGVLRGRHVFST